jgi:hypothetical protein
MGKIIYGPGGSSFEVDDRTLAHLQLVILMKLRRNETFPFTWWPERNAGQGRVTVWFHPAQEVQFSYSGSKVPDINRRWVEELLMAANSGTGLRAMPEPSTTPGDPLG